MRALRPDLLLGPLLSLAQLATANFGSGRPIPQVEAAVSLVESKLSAWYNFVADPASHSGGVEHGRPLARPPSEFWLGNIKHQGIAPFAGSGYKVFRNVLDYGAKGDGVTDDTAAINLAVSSGNRCGPTNCASSTVTPAIVYFPPGEYLVSSSIIDYYFTMLIGDVVNLPILKASAEFGGSGLGVIDGDLDHLFGSTNIFYRQIANFVIDLTAVPPVNSQGGGPTGIHWPTGQATSIQNVRILMNDSPDTAHQGIYIEDGSGGYIGDVTFIGGKVGGQFGNQQFTMRNLTFENCKTAISHSFDWGWVYAGLGMRNCSTGIDMTALTATGTLNVGGLTMIDSSATDVEILIKTARNETSQPTSGGSLALENIRLSNVPITVQGTSNVTVLEGTKGSSVLRGYLAGNKYTPKGPAVAQGLSEPFPRPQTLITSNGDFYTRSKPQYSNLGVKDFLSVRDFDARGNAVADDTNALNAAIQAAQREGKVLFVDCGIYKVTSTIKFPPGLRIVGEAYPNIMASGSFFSDSTRPQPVIQVGLPGEFGRIEWSNMVISTQGPAKGAILIEYNLASPATDPAGMWDVHVRVGGFKGSNLQLAECPTTTDDDTLNPNCLAAHTMMHVTKTAQGLYMENNWLWASDHDIEDANLTMIDVYSVRGLLVESAVGNLWLWGTAVEHNAMYQYEFYNTKNIFMGFIQTETAYYEPHPNASEFQSRANGISNIFGSTDPDFDFFCAGRTHGICKDGWALRILSTTDILSYGAGLYSFFDNQNVTCSDAGVETCQTQIFGVDSGSPKSALGALWDKNSQVRMYNLNTVGAVAMATVDNVDVAFEKDNTGPFPECIALFESLGG